MMGLSGQAVLGCDREAGSGGFQMDSGLSVSLVGNG